MYMYIYTCDTLCSRKGGAMHSSNGDVICKYCWSATRRNPFACRRIKAANSKAGCSNTAAAVITLT